MAITLVEAAKYTTNMVKRGVLEEIYKDSVVLQKLPFIDVVGNAYQYLRENTLPTANFYAPNEVWSEDTGDVTQVTAFITILGGDADVDNFIQATRSDKNDIKADQLARKAKAVKHTFLNSFWYGANASNPKEFNGVHVLTPAAQRVNEGSGSTGSALNASNMDIAFHRIRDGKPDVIVMTREIHMRMAQYLRGKANLFVTNRNEYGEWMTSWNGVPVVFDDFLTQTETIASGTYSAKTGGATSSIFFLRFGTEDLLGLQNGGLTTKKIGQLESKDAERHRIRWYVGLALMRTISIARIDGVTDVAMVD